MSALFFSVTLSCSEVVCDVASHSNGTRPSTPRNVLSATVFGCELINRNRFVVWRCTGEVCSNEPCDGQALTFRFDATKRKMVNVASVRVDMRHE